MVRYCGTHAALLLLIAGAVSGCQTNPVAPPEAGEAPAAVMSRMYEMHVEQHFVTGGHRYTAARAASGGSDYYNVIFIDGAVACKTDESYESIDDFRQDAHRAWRDYSTWEWVAEPDGLDYLASRLRQACELEPSTPRRESPVEWSSDEEEVKIAEPPSTAQTIGGGLLVSVAATAFILLGPLFAVGAGAEEAYLNSAYKSVSERVLFSLPQPEPALRQALGNPDVVFDLPNAGTRVLGYDPKSGRSLYFGVREGLVVWVHGEYPWLDRLADKAVKETKGDDEQR